MRKERVLFGAVDIGGRIAQYSAFIKEKLNDRLEAESVAKYKVPAKHYKTSYTYEFNAKRWKGPLQYVWYFAFFIYALFRFRQFHFLSGETLLTRKLMRFEFSIYKLLGKRIVMHFVGADIRSIDYLKWKSKAIHAFLAGEAEQKRTTAWQDQLAATSRKYADKIIVSTPDLLAIIPEATYYPVVINIEGFLKELQQVAAPQKDPDKVVILHAPSNTSLKGSELIHPVLKKIAAEDEGIELILTAEINKGVERYAATKYEMFAHYRKADIVIDQLIIGWYGMQSIEALLSGSVAICYVEKELKMHLFPDSPIINADANNLEEKVKTAIQMVREQKVNVAAQTTWVRQYHTLSNNHQALLKALDVE